MALCRAMKCMISFSSFSFVDRIRIVYMAIFLCICPVISSDPAPPVASSSLFVTSNSSTNASLFFDICAKDALFRCPGSGRCIPKAWICDGDNDCGRGEDELNCSEKKCGADEFKCAATNKCIPNRWLCDAEDDCGDEADELEHLCANRSCGAGQYKCQNNSHCIPRSWICDGQPDCADTSDEKECKADTCSPTEFQCKNGRCVFSRWMCDHDDDCGDKSDEENCTYSCQSGQFMCKSDQRCIPERWVCDGEPDCHDHSDEQGCKQSSKSHLLRNVTCNPRYEFRCDDGQCIHNAWKCDGDKDCPDGSDEKNCTKTACNDTEFTCSEQPLRCIPKDLKCNGINDCEGGEDENGCQNTPSPKKCDTTQFDCGNGVCIDSAEVCDGKNDCPNKADEEPITNCTIRVHVNECDASRPCELHATCKTGTYGSRCICSFGFKPKTNSTERLQCEDINECDTSPHTRPVCSQICRNTVGSYRCMCQTGYALLRDKRTCRGLGNLPKLWLSNKEAIIEIDLVTRRRHPVLVDLDSVVAMDYSARKRLVFWSDVTKEIIYMSGIPNAKNVSISTQNLTQLVKHKLSTPDGIAVDWVHDLLYWTDTGYNTISVVNFDGTLRKTLINESLDEPRAIALDPSDGLMFWTDWGSAAKIERASMDGTGRLTIIDTSIEWPNGLAVDLVDRRIFWADAKLKMISSCDYSGSNRIIVLNSWSSLRHPFSLAVFEETVYWTDWDTEGIHAVNKYTGLGETSNGSLILEKLGGPMTVRVYQELSQPYGYNKCLKADCAQLCLPAFVDRKLSVINQPLPYSCHCADGYLLNSDGKNCDKDGSDMDSLDSGPKMNQGTIEGGAGSASVAAGIIACVAAIGACAGFVFWRRMRKNPNRMKRLNFGNPIYRRTILDDSNENGDSGGGIHYDHLRLSVDASDQYNPIMDTMHTSSALRLHGNSFGGSGSGVYQPTTTNGADTLMGVGVVQNGKYSMTLPLTEHEEGSEYA